MYDVHLNNVIDNDRMVIIILKLLSIWKWRFKDEFWRNVYPTDDWI